MARLRIGSRGSQLALWQAHHISDLLRERGHEVELEIIKTTGDKITDVALAKVGTKGMFTKEIDGKTFVSAVFPDKPAARAGLLAGDEVVTADGKPFAPVASFRDKTGEKVKLEVRREANGPLKDFTVEPEWIEPGEAFEQRGGVQGARLAARRRDDL